jgi:heptaprenyl diphosphate synthase
MAQRKRESGGSASELTRLSLLTAIALIIFIVEQQVPFPLPIPGAKLGLANIITVYAVNRCRSGGVLLLVLARIFLGSLFGGAFLSPAMIFSLAGGLLCLAGMLPLRKILDEKHIWLGSIFGAVLHNTGQIIAAVFVMKTAAVIGYYPFLLVIGCIAGAFTGLTAQIIINRLK